MYARPGFTNMFSHDDRGKMIEDNRIGGLLNTIHRIFVSYGYDGLDRYFNSRGWIHTRHGTSEDFEYIDRYTMFRSFGEATVKMIHGYSDAAGLISLETPKGVFVVKMSGFILLREGLVMAD